MTNTTNASLASQLKELAKKPLVLGALAIAVVGLAINFTMGENLTQDSPWGLYVAFFFFFEALASGCMLFAALFDNDDRPTLLAIGAVSGMAAGVVILRDVGNVLNSWRLFVSPNLQAPMFLDVVFLTLLLVLGIVLLVLTLKGSTAGTKPLAIALAVVAIAFPLGSSWLCVTEAGRVGWNSSFEMIFFIYEAVMAGVVVMALLHREEKWMKAAGWMLIAAAVMILMEVGLGLYSTGHEHLPLLTMATGAYAPLFWVQLVCGFALPGVMFLMGASPLAAGCIGFAGIALQKLVFMLQGNLYPALKLGDTTVSYDYLPSVGEWGICIAAVAVVAACAWIVANLKKPVA